MKKANSIFIYTLAIMGLALVLVTSCKKTDDNSNPPPTPETVTDIDGNMYHTVTIGTQTWMVENLRTTKFNDGTAIPLVTDDTEWGSLTTPGYCWYDNASSAYKTPYGALYNWFTVNTGKLAPTGWHIPTDAEWTTLTTYLGGEAVAGGKIKTTGTIEAGTGLWNSPNTGATNESGFTALPGGGRDSYGVFFNLSGNASFWSSTEYSSTHVWGRVLYYSSGNVYGYYYYKTGGFSCRCLKN